MYPKFFRFRHSGDRGYPVVDSMKSVKMRGPNPIDISTGEVSLDPNSKTVTTFADMELPEIEISSKGTKWPDVLGHFQYGYGFLFSDRLVELILEEDLTGLEFQQVRIVKIRSKRLQAIEAPEYYIPRVTGRAVFSATYYKYQRGKLHYFGKSDTPKKKKSFRDNELSIHVKVKEDTWDGSDFFAECSSKYMLIGFCTEEFINLCINHNITNIVFGAFDALNPSENTIFQQTDAEFPPQNWYPEYQPIEEP